jgi:hypothetical protein
VADQHAEDLRAQIAELPLEITRLAPGLAQRTRDFRVEVIGHWPETEVAMTFLDDYRPGVRLRVRYSIFDAQGRPKYLDDDPSGDLVGNLLSNYMPGLEWAHRGTLDI